MSGVRRCVLLSIWLMFATVSSDTSAASACGHQPTKLLQDLADNSWLLVDQGSVTAPLDIMAYSGGWYDAQQHRFCIFGGGHYNYSGNEIWCFDIATLTWTELYNPDVVTTPPYDGGDPGPYANYDNARYPGALFKPAGEAIQDAQPMSRHTYDQLEYIDGFGALLWGGFAWGDSASPWCTECEDTWVFTSDERGWKYLFDGHNRSPNISPGVGASAYSSHDNTLYAKVRQETWSYDPEENRWSKVATKGAPPWSIEGTLEYDPIHRKLYFFGGNYDTNNTLWKFDIGKRAWAAVNPAGEAPSAASNGPGIAYDTHNDALLIYYGGSIWVYEPATNTWELQRPDTRPTDNDYVFGRFRYDPVNNGFWLHAAADGQHSTWFYRYRN